jgi:hypothetical protein
MKFLTLLLLAFPILLPAQHPTSALMVRAKADGYDSSKHGKYLRVKASLVNNRDYTLAFCDMTCSYSDVFTIKAVI